MPADINGYDYAVLIFYLLATIALGFWVSRRGVKTSGDYFLGGHNLPWYVVGGSMVATDISTEHFIANVGAAYKYGIVVAAGSWNTWIIYSLLISFGGTVAANGLRIFVSAHLWDADIYGGWMTRELMHRLAGVAIYYASLLTLYCVVESRVGTRAHRLAPLLWYVGISLGIPLAGRLVAGGAQGFAGHAAWVTAVALTLTLATALPSALRNRIHCRP